MGIRREARINALKSLYLIDTCDMSVEESLKAISQNSKMHPELSKFMETLVKGTAENIDEIDRLITANAENWTLNRMATVDRNILRIGTYELMKMTDIPVNVIIKIKQRFNIPISDLYFAYVVDVKRRRFVQFFPDRAAFYAID